MGDKQKKMVVKNVETDSVLTHNAQQHLDELTADRRAALNLMEDAVHANQRADVLIVKLRDEAEARKKVEEALRESEELKTFLLKFSDALRPLACPAEVQDVAVLMLGEALQVDRCCYAELDRDRQTVVVNRECVGSFSTSLKGEHPMEFFRSMVELVESGEPLICNDVNTHPVLSSLASDYQERGMRAILVIPFIKKGVTITIMCLTMEQPREWKASEVHLLNEAAERAWLAVERARAEELLRESEQRLQRMVNVPRVGVLTFDHSGTMLDVNDALLEMIGYSRSEFKETTRTWRDFTPPEYLEESERQFDKMRQKGVFGPYEKEYFRKDGSRIWMMFVAADLGDGTIIEYAVDINDRVLAQQALSESEEQYRTLFNSIDEGFCTMEVLFDDHGRSIDCIYLEANPAFVRQTGVENAIGKTMREVAPDLEEFWFQTYGDIVKTGKPRRFEHQAETLDRYYDVYAFPVGTAGQNRIAVVFNDIRIRKEAEESLFESSERMRLLIESAIDVSIFTTDKKGIVNSWNTGSERIFGWSEDEIIGQSMALFYTLEDRANNIPENEMLIAEEEGRALDERWHLRKDGTQFFSSGMVHPIGIKAKDGFVKIARDMTSKLIADEEKREKEVLQFLIYAQESERKRIARDLHDELGQQLTALRWKLDRLKTEIPEPLIAQMNDIQMIAGKIDDGVDFLAWELRPAVLDDLGLPSAIQKYVTEWSSYSGINGIVETLKIGDKKFDPAIETALYRIVQEGLSNVHKHAKASNAEVIIGTRKGELVLTIHDNGIGFDPNDQELVSRGIGLLGMEERVKMLGGNLEIESRIGHGTTLYISAPVKSKI